MKQIAYRIVLFVVTFAALFAAITWILSAPADGKGLSTTDSRFIAIFFPTLIAMIPALAPWGDL